MAYTLYKQIKDNPYLRKSFDALAQKTFDISFESWYQHGFWTDSYLPYVFADGDKVVACAAVNVMDFLWHGQSRRYIQLGTVMTDSAHRGRGLSRRLITEILNDWQQQCDALYLFANDTVLDFYPKFGFCKAEEYQYSTSIAPTVAGSAKKLNMDLRADLALVASHYALSNPFSALQFVDNYGLLAFGCLTFLKDSVYYSETYDAVIIAEHDGSTMTCYDVFGGKDHSLDAVLSDVLTAETTSVRLGFTPTDTTGYKVEPFHEEDTTLFVFAGKENILTQNQVMFPLLSHA